MRSVLIPRSHRRSALLALRELREFDRLFDELWRGFGAWPTRGADVAAAGFSPRIDVSEEADAVVVTAELPGLEPKEFDLSLEGDVLTLAGEKRSEHRVQGRGYRHVETVAGSFERRVALPGGIDADRVEATFRNGVLRVRLPRRADARPEARTVPVTTA